jgi:hypothetical protein
MDCGYEGGCMSKCSKCGEEIKIVDGVLRAHQQKDHVTFLCDNCEKGDAATKELEAYKKFKEDVEKAEVFDDELGMIYIDNEIDEALEMLRKRLAIIRGEEKGAV